MSDRYNLSSPRPGKEGKTFWMKIGAAFPREKGGFMLTLDALPLPDKEGKVSILMTLAEPKNISSEQFKEAQNATSSTVEELQDSIPF